MSREIQLPCGKVAIVDDEDYERVSQFHWQAQAHRNTVYARRWVSWSPRQAQYLHRFLMNPAPGVQVDHIDGNGLNCTRANMRLASQRENCRNQRLRKNNKSGYRGVTWRKQMSKWYADIKVDYRPIRLGGFNTPEEAARAYDKAALRYFGEFAALNFPQDGQARCIRQK